MAAAIALREDFSAAVLRALARQSRDSRQWRRRLALAAVAEGRSWSEAAEIGGMGRELTPILTGQSRIEMEA